jgi:TadE-like protein
VIRQVRADREHGASAVEFALVMPILFLFLFGIVQYGYGFYQLQAFSAALGDASRLAATGILDCPAFQQTWGTLAGDNGLTGQVDALDVQWLTADGAPSAAPDRLGLARVTATFTPDQAIRFPGIPFPSHVTRTRTVPIQDIGTVGLPGC